jgi:hypothetical protein
MSRYGHAHVDRGFCSLSCHVGKYLMEDFVACIAQPPPAEARTKFLGWESRLAKRAIGA